MDNNNTHIKSIVNNTLFLYVRMMLVMAVALYTTRIVLKQLGATNWGVYCVIGGVVVALTFVSGVMKSMSQRFLCYEIGQKNALQLQRVFNAIMVIHFGGGLLFLLLGETVGMWFVQHCLNLGTVNFSTSRNILHFVLLISCIQVLQVPYTACLIAYEQMNLYAAISIVEATLKLGVALSLPFFPADKLVSYVVLNFVASLVIFLSYLLLCRWKFRCCRLMWCRDWGLYKKLLHFSAWSIWGSLAGMAEQQGFNFLINIYYGIVYNAALGIAHQLGMGVYSFVSNFQVAFNPRIVKTYAEQQPEEHLKLIMTTTKLSFYLLFFFAFPLFLQLDFILSIWLGQYPESTLSFGRFELLLLLLDVMSAPLWMSVQATGKIWKYQLLIGTLSIARLPLIYLVLALGYSLDAAWLVRIGGIAVLFATRVIFMHYHIGLDYIRYWREALAPVVRVLCLTLPLPCILNCFVSGWGGFFLVGSMCVVVFVLSCWKSGLTKDERRNVLEMATSRLSRVRLST